MAEAHVVGKWGDLLAHAAWCSEKRESGQEQIGGGKSSETAPPLGSSPILGLQRVWTVTQEPSEQQRTLVVVGKFDSHCELTKKPFGSPKEGG